MAYGIEEHDDARQITPAVKAIVIINVALAFLQVTVLPSDTYLNLGFQTSDFLKQWWTPLTSMFVHGGVLHLAFNMYTLWLFGRRLEKSWEWAAFTRYYLWCGLGGVLLHAAMQSGGVLIGASGAIMGVMFAYAVLWPDEELLLFGVIPMKVKMLVTLLVVVNLVMGILSVGQMSGIAYFAHLGGVLFGVFYMHLPSPGSFERFRHRVSPVPDESDDPPRVVPRSMPRREKMSEIDEIVARSNAVVPRRGGSLVPSRKAADPQVAEALDQLLDKISERGLDSLTPAERKLLEEKSKELRRTP
jgi:membrane associated rhomboid family serine protease